MKRRPVSFVEGRPRHLEAWQPGQKHLQPPLDPLETAAQERERIGQTEIKKKAPKNKIGTLWSLFSHPPDKRQMTSGLFSNILGSWDEAKIKDDDLDLSMLMGEAEVEEMLDRIGRTSISKIFSPTCNHGTLWLNQEGFGEQDFKGGFPQKMARPRKRETELMLGEVGPGRGLFSNILSRLDGREKRAWKRAQGVKSLFTHILR